MAETTNSEKPQNGVKGLKHWRYDLMAGFQVALVSLPLSLGIAIASGAPPITGVISAIIAGLIFPFLGGAYVTISGPAAGLAPALLAGMIMLGNGDLAAGYPLLLVAICLTGVLQIILSLFNAGRFALFLPVTVVEAMLAAIGIMIIVKQIPALLGAFVPPAKSMLIAISNIPTNFLLLDPSITLIGGVCLFFMFYLKRSHHALLRHIPAPLFVAALGIALGYLMQLDAKYLITMPDNILKGGFTLPAFETVWNRSELWSGIILMVITLTLIDGIESLATIAAVDKIDPYQRKSHPNVTLRAMGVSNTLSSIFGGLTIIPGGVKSRANIDAGGRTLWANFYNAMFLIVFLFLAKDMVSRIPLASIAAILVYVGWRLCEYQVFRKTFAIGRDQFIIFLVTLVAILCTNLLYGIMIGVAAEITLLAYLLTPSFRAVLTGRLTLIQAFKLLWGSLTSLLCNPVIKVKIDESGVNPHYNISLGSIVCFNLLPFDKLLGTIPQRAGITLTVTESGRIIDHTAMEYLHRFHEECLQANRPFSIEGLENFYQFTGHELSARMHDAKLVKEKTRLTAREQLMATVAQRHGFQFTPAAVGTYNSHDFVYLRRGANRQESNVMTGIHNGCQVKIFDYCHTTAPDYYSEHCHTVAVSKRIDKNAVKLPNLAFTPGHYLERYLVEYQEVALKDHPVLAEHYRIYSQYPELRINLKGSILERILIENPGFYVEIRNNTLLAFRPGQYLEPPETIELLFDLAAALEELTTSSTLETEHLSNELAIAKGAI